MQSDIKNAQVASSTANLFSGMSGFSPVFIKKAWLVAVVGLIFFGHLSLPVLQAQGLRTGDEVWEISTRRSGTCPPDLAAASQNFQVYRYQCPAWRTVGQEEFWAVDSGTPSISPQNADIVISDSKNNAALSQPYIVPQNIRVLSNNNPDSLSKPITIIYVHGNWMTESNSRDRALLIYRSIIRHCAPPIRFILFSWPSQRNGRPLQDIRSHAELANVEGLYFAWLLRHLSADQQVSLMGFSFGGKVVASGLHLDAGGQIRGYSLPPDPNPHRKYRVSLLAPAIDRTSLMQGREFGLALTKVDQLVNLYNSRDPVLKRFRFIDTFRDPVAAGFVGLALPAVTQPLTTQLDIRQFDCGQIVGATHSEESYYSNCPHVAKAMENLLWISP